MDPDKIKIPVPMSDVRKIYAALGSLKRIAANEGNDEFVQTLDGLINRLKDYHNTVATEWGAGHEDLIRGAEEYRSAPPGQEPHREALPQERAELPLVVQRPKGGANRRHRSCGGPLISGGPHDEEVRRACDQAIQRRPGAPPL
jgi:hypothetical protein